MTVAVPDYEVRFNGQEFLRVNNGTLDVHGVDFERDLASISHLISILSDVLYSAASSRPRQVIAAQDDNVVYLKTANSR